MYLENGMLGVPEPDEPKPVAYCYWKNCQNELYLGDLIYKLINIDEIFCDKDCIMEYLVNSTEIMSDIL